jgi:hypothetical protein
MTPFKIKVSVDHYESMNYQLKVGDKLYQKDKHGNHLEYAELISFDPAQNVWLGKTASMKSTPLAVKTLYISLLVVPFDQYLKKGDKNGFFSVKK